MSQTYAPQTIVDLVEAFENNIEAYQSPQYKEAEVRAEYVDPLFEALGWDVHNRRKYAESYKDVVLEPSIEEESGSRAPDYSFQPAGHLKFYVEAKKPIIDLDRDPRPAHQLRMYGWTKQLALSILTNFAQFAVYDCRIPPRATDDPSVARVQYLSFHKYTNRWDELVSLFSPAAVFKGSFDRFIETRERRGTAPFDERFLNDMEEWRKRLARNIALRNPSISVRDLNYAVQQTIDRTIFLRICEARKIEPFGRLRDLAKLPAVYRELLEYFRVADGAYNSGLFHFRREQGRDLPDELTPTLHLDDTFLKQIINQLYWPERPYAFEVVPADILGQVYERFLGKVIYLTAGHRADVEEKPEVRRAGGVYYTPTYIVNYIVAHTVGSLLERKTWKTSGDIRILDPACGSGSFLLGAYQYLCDWYLDEYCKDPEKHRNRLYRTPAGLRLTIAQKKDILLRHIYGVDVDPQAVEVTKLSLLLKVLEGESDMTVKPRLIKEPALPDLDKNIKCGNSLIGPEFYRHEQMQLLEDAAKERINVFDWRHGFPHIMKSGGFHAVIGNPPYRRELNFKYLMDEIAATPFGAKYRSPRMDLWYYFVHRALASLLRKRGSLGFIVNAYWVAGTGSEKLIQQLRDDAHIDEIFFLGELKVFRKVSGSHMVLCITNAGSTKSTFIKRVPPGSKGDAEPFVLGKQTSTEYEKTHSQLFRDGKIDLEEPVDDLLRRMAQETPLGKIGTIRQGIAENPPSITRKANKRFGNRWTVGEGVFALKTDELRNLNLSAKERTLIKPYYDLCDLGRYWRAEKPSLHLIYSTRNTWAAENKYPRLREHLAKFKPIMDQRRETKSGTVKWWQLHWPREERLWTSDKIVSIQMATRPSFLLATGDVFTSFSTNVFLKSDGAGEDLRYIVSLLNSKLLWKWFRHNAKRRGGLEINGNVLQRAPVHLVGPSEKAFHDELCQLADHIQSATAKLAAARTAHERSILKPQIDALERRIDEIVYKLYGLTKAEIAMVEGPGLAARQI